MLEIDPSNQIKFKSQQLKEVFLLYSLDLHFKTYSGVSVTQYLSHYVN